MRIGLQTKVILSIGILLLLVCAVGYLLHFEELKNSQLRSAKEELETTAYFLARDIGRDYEIEYQQNLQDVVDIIYSHADNLIEIAVLDTFGVVLAANREEILDSVMESPAVLEVIDCGDSHLIVNLGQGIWTCQAVAPIPPDYSNHSEIKGYLAITSSLESTQELLNLMMKKQVLIVILGLILTVFIAAALSRKVIIKPIQDLSRATRKVAHGEFSALPERKARDEIADLIRSFNAMVKELSHTRGEMEDYNRTLKQTVAEEAEKLNLAAEQLYQSEKLSALGQLIAGVAHELNNPLAVIMGNAQLLLATDLDEELKRKISVIDQSAERSQKIVQNLLSFARQAPSKKSYIGINGIIKDCLDLKSYDYRSNRIKVIEELEENLPKTMADFHQLQQVFINILDNAQHALITNQDEKVLIVKTESISRTIHISLTDNGPGIPQDILNRIFEPFYTTKEQGKGTGLGLSIAYGIIEKHRGKLSVSSEPGKGTTFKITLPILGDPSDRAGAGGSKGEKARSAKDETKAKKENRGENILVIDDENHILDMLFNLLKNEGYKVDTARNGRIAMEKIQDREYEVILSDLRMPQMSGEQLFEWLKKTKPDIAKRMIFLTGDIVNADTVKFLRKSGCMYLQKPFNVETLKKIIADHLSSRKFIAPVAPNVFLEKTI